MEFSRSDAWASVAKAAAAASTIIWKRNTSVSAGWIRETLIYSVIARRVATWGDPAAFDSADIQDCFTAFAMTEPE
jgi:hypothetical protein